MSAIKYDDLNDYAEYSEADRARYADEQVAAERASIEEYGMRVAASLTDEASATLRSFLFAIRTGEHHV